LFGYFHEQHVEIFSFQQNRFRFVNTFEIRHSSDAVFFLLSVWKQLNMSAQTDELHLVGDLFQGTTVNMTEEREALLTQLRQFLMKVYVINPTADFNRAQVTELPGMPYDLQTLYVKGL
jgi:flagellar basal body rod protein FlgF